MIFFIPGAGVAGALINANAAVDLPDSNGLNPLMRAEQQGDLCVAKTLIEANASIDATEEYSGNSALYLAAWGNNQDIVLLLLQNGADQMIPGSLGYPPAALARLRGHDQLAALIESYTITTRVVATTGS